MSQNGDTKSGEQLDGCMFPTGPDGQVCGRPRAVNGKTVGGRRMYCDDPDHTRIKAFAVRRRYGLAPARSHSTNDQGATQAAQGMLEHPVTDGRVSLAALLVRFEETGTQLATILNRTTEVIHTITDPDAASYEVEQRQRKAEIQVAQAQRAQAAAEHQASNARKQAAQEAEQRAQADEAAEQALCQLH
jgi:colicin import membrane protein